MGLAFPTRTQLGWLAEHPTSDAALAAYRGRSTEPLMPELDGEGEDARVVLPGVADSQNRARALRAPELGTSGDESTAGASGNGASPACQGPGG